jgi:hypothetical protein
MKSKIPIAKWNGISHNYTMVKPMSYFIVAMTLFCGVASGGDIDLSSLTLENFNASTWANGTLLNGNDTDSRYSGLVDFDRQGTVSRGGILTITAEVTLNPSNVVSIAFGDEFSNALKLECRESVWEIRCGRRHAFADPIPPLQQGTNTCRIRFATSERGGYSPTVAISVNGGNEVSANHLAPSKSQWKGMGDPSLFTHVRVALRGAGSGVRSIRHSWSEPGSLVILR